MRGLKTALLACAAISVMTGGATGQEFDRVVTFGDSLSDNGNLFLLTGQPPSPPYNMRFSNGLVFTELFAGGMVTAGAAVATGQPLPSDANLNFAFGGARADDDLNLSDPTIPSVPDQIGFFQASGQSFDGDELVTLLAGNNDIFQGLPTVDSLAGAQALGANAANDVLNDLQALTALGARQIVVFGLPDLAQTPQFNSDPTAGPAAGAASGAFNATLEQGLLQTIPNLPAGTNVIFIPLAPALDAVVADPAASGFTNVSQACLSVASCASASFDQQNEFLFFDGVHPTQGGYELFAALVADYVVPEAATAGAGALGAVTTELRFQSMLSAFDRARSVLAAPHGVTATADLALPGVEALPAYRVGGPYIEARGLFLEETDAGVDSELGQLRFGYDVGLGDTLVVGGSLGGFYGSNDGRYEYDLAGGSVDLYALKSFGAAFVSAGLGGSLQSYYDVTRASLVRGLEMEAEGTDGYTLGASLGAGYRFGIGRAAITPNVALAGIYDHVDAYEEVRGGGARYAYEDRERTTALVSARVDLAIPFGLALVGAHFGYEGALTDAEDDVTVQAGLTALPQTVDLETTDGRGFVAGLSLTSRLSERLRASAEYSVGVDDDDVSHIAGARLGIAF